MKLQTALLGTVLGALFGLLMPMQETKQTSVYAPFSSTINMAYGTAWVLNEEGYLITANHVVDQAKKFYIYYNEEWVEIKLVKVDTVNDIAVLKAPINFFHYFTLQNNYPLIHYPTNNVGSDASVIGHPLAAYCTHLFCGEYLDTAHDKIVFNTDLCEGDSGGPVLDQYGNVIGLSNFAFIMFPNQMCSNYGGGADIDKVRDLAKSLNIKTHEQYLPGMSLPGRYWYDEYYNSSFVIRVTY